MTKEKEETVEVRSLCVKLGKKEVTLSIEEAKKLKKALDELFGKTEEHHHYHTKEVVRDYSPLRDYVPYRPYWYNDWTYRPVYCGTTSGNITLENAASQASNTLLCDLSNVKL